ncbi:MAG TPA: type II toxin-antitoxin system VapC family toxin [Gemmatimonadaceae bacterium]|nr:type II toxin-antitoxin system VapC family toxin [Gemmatimonadaceae bacterium]
MILDTSVLIEAERGHVRMEALLASVGDEPVGIAAVTAAELLFGCHRASTAASRARRFAFVDAVLDLVPVIPFGLVEARRHAELWDHLARRGRMIGAHDLIIGATALAHGQSVATLNVREFRRLPGLRLVRMREFRA